MVAWSKGIYPGVFIVSIAILSLVEPMAAQSADPHRQAPPGRSATAEDIDRIRGDLSKIRQQLEHRLKTIEQQLDSLESRLPGPTAGARSSERAGQAEKLGAADRGALTIAPTVCREGCRFSDLNEALKATEVGGTIAVAPGFYGFCGVILQPVRLIGLRGPAGKRAHLAGGVCEGKASLVVRAPDVVIEGFEISNVTVPHRNGACVRIDPQAGDVVIRDMYCHDSENGILGGSEQGHLLIEDSIFERNGAGNGQAHGVYIERVDEFIVRNSRILSTKGHGHTLKSGARRTIIEDSVLAALDGTNSRAVDVFGGGELVVRRSVIQQGKNSDNYDAIGIALEARRIHPEPHSTTLEDNWFLFDDPSRCCRLLFSAKQFGPITMRGNRIVAMTEFSDSPLNLDMANNQLFEDRARARLPAYDGTLSSLPKPGVLH